jgi:hypothetical protein
VSWQKATPFEFCNLLNNPNMTPHGAIKMIIFGSVAAGTALLFTVTFGMLVLI